MEKRKHKRLVLFCTGYDPAGTPRYYLMLKQQMRYYTKRFKTPLKLGKLTRSAAPDTPFSLATITAEWPEGDCETLIATTDWLDIVEKDVALNPVQRTLKYLPSYAYAWTAGIFPRLLKWQIKFLFVLSVPFVFLLVRLIIVVLGALLGLVVARFLPVPSFIPIAIGALGGVTAVWGLRKYFASFFESHLANSLSYQKQVTAKVDDELVARAELFNERAIALVEAEKPDDILIIGHSCGPFFSFPMHKAFLDRGIKCVHMTIGSMLPFSIEYRSEKFFRPLCEEILAAEDARLIEYFAPQDPFSVPFARLDKDYGLTVKGDPSGRYTVRSANFTQIFDPKKLRIFRFNPLRMHFQYLSANDNLGEFDYFRIITHPDAVKNDLLPTPTIKKDNSPTA